jgi:trehalose 6-phosphate phosphatase
MDGLGPEVKTRLDLLRRDPPRTCLVTDFDGTLSPIVADPDAARPLEGVAAALAQLSQRYGRVAVVSGRPASFLIERLSLVPPLPATLAVAGLYGLERLASDGSVASVAEAERWRAVVQQAAERAEAEGPSGLRVERKGLTVTLHWRTNPSQQSWAEEFLQEMAQELGLQVHPARRSGELRPPLAVDKGTVVAELVEGFSAACFLGDDLGDLPAFAALDDLEKRGATVVKVAVVSEEAPSGLLAQADVSVPGPEAALAVLRYLGRP